MNFYCSTSGGGVDLNGNENILLCVYGLPFYQWWLYCLCFDSKHEVNW